MAGSDACGSQAGAMMTKADESKGQGMDNFGEV